MLTYYCRYSNNNRTRLVFKTLTDMELIEVLWKQDVDMGFSLEQFQEAGPELVGATAEAEIVQEKCKALKIDPEPVPNKNVDDEPSEDDPWAGLPYTIDLETGEYILKEECDAITDLCEDEPPSALLDQADFSLEEALQLVGLNEDTFELPECAAVPERELPVIVEGAHEVLSEGLSEAAAESPLTETSLEEDLDLLAEMIQAPNYHHSRSFQEYGYSLCYDLRGQSSGGECFNPASNNSAAWQRLTEIKDNISRMPYMRTVNMEQRWQDLASLLSLPPPGGAGAVGAVPGGGMAASEYHGHGPGHHHGHGHGHGHVHGHGYHHGQAYLGPPHAFQPPPACVPHAPDKLLHNTSTPVPPPTPSLPPDPYSPISSGNLGTAVASSMNLMTNNSEPMGGDAAAANFKIENPHDMMYYQNGSSEIGHNNADGFLSSILNDEDLQLMDMAMNEGMYTMRMLEGGNGGGGGGCGSGSGGSGGTDSDSAVSSMGSERVPSLTSDTDWMETNSDSGHTPADHFMTDYHNKYRWYDYGYARQHSGESANGGSHRMPPVAQKKHHLYGKRFFQEQTAGNNSPILPQNSPSCTGNGTTPIKFEFNNSSSSSSSSGAGTSTATVPSPSVVTANSFNSPPLDMVKGHQPEMKYSCSVEFTRQNQAGARSNPAEAAVHNHTYHMPPEQSGVLQRPLTRDKKVRRNEEEHHLTRDERRARALNIPISVDDIINLPMDEFNERLSKYDLSEAQLSLIRDVRRRGKNKVAAQNCRKRKLDQILSLADEVKQMKEKKQRLVQERERLLSERLRVKNRFTQLYRHIFQALRDPDGNPYSPYEWSLQQSADGTVVLIPRGNQTILDQNNIGSDPPRPSKKPQDQSRKP